MIYISISNHQSYFTQKAPVPTSTVKGSELLRLDTRPNKNSICRKATEGWYCGTMWPDSSTLA